MTDDRAPLDVASAWIAAVSARGVVLGARGKKLLMSPKSAYRELLTDEERRTWKGYQREIVALVKDGAGLDASRQGSAQGVRAGGDIQGSLNSSAPPPPPEPPPICMACGRQPCIGVAHEHYALLHPHAPPRPRVTAEELIALATDERGTRRESACTYGSTRDDPSVMNTRPLPDWWTR